MSINQLVDSLTGLERILTTPIPFSYVLRFDSQLNLNKEPRYAIHLWVVTILYLLAMVCLAASHPYCLLTLPIALANLAVNEVVDNTSYHTFCARLVDLMHPLDRQHL